MCQNQRKNIWVAINEEGCKYSWCKGKLVGQNVITSVNNRTWSLKYPLSNYITSENPFKRQDHLFWGTSTKLLNLLAGRELSSCNKPEGS